MVGASGALFGLTGGLLAWLYVDRYTRSEGLLPVAQAVMALFIFNLVLWWAMDGHLAWETHLGGFLTGWIFALLMRDYTLQDMQVLYCLSPIVMVGITFLGAFLINGIQNPLFGARCTEELRRRDFFKKETNRHDY